MSDAKEVEAEKVEVKSDKKSPRNKLRMSHDERKSTSPIEKFVIRQSTDSPQTNYEIVTSKTEGSNEETSRHLLSPQVKLTRYVPEESPKEKFLNNGLEPLALELISSSIATPKAASEYSDKSDESFSTPKISREMKNLQKSTNNSKILSNYLHSAESPRNRRKTMSEPVVADPLEIPAREEEVTEAIDEKEEEEEAIKEKEIDEMEVDEENDKETNESADSDSTLVLHPMEPPEKRRKSMPRSRSRSRNNMRGRTKSIHRQLKDELNVTSDKDETFDEEEDDMSEVSYVSNPSLEGRSVKPPPKAGWDSFCFKCHTDTAVLSLACSKCKCSYHRHCVRPNPIPKNVENFICPECLEVETAETSTTNKYGHERIDQHTLAEMLTIILEKIRTYPDRDHFETDIVVKTLKEQSLPLIVTQMSLKTIETRIKMRYYKVSEAFIHDIKQLEHNWNIVDRSKSKSLKAIIKYVVTEINELEACVFCYEESFVSGDWFIHPCKRPHLLIWAKLKGYPFWPAKVMSIDARQQVDVRFFGAHDRAWVPSVHCMLFSEKDPNKTKGATPTSSKNVSKTQKGIADAMKEKDGYIENLRAKYGFKYAPLKQQLDPNNLQGQLEAMLPNLKNAKEGEKEADGTQKKLTLKIIKGQSSNYQVEHKSSEPRTPSVKDKSLYKVLSKNDDNTKEVDGKLHPLIIKRKSNVEQEVERSKRSRTASETSGSNASVQSSKPASIQRRKSMREPPKSKKVVKNVEPPAKKKVVAEKNQKEEEETASVEESSKSKSMRKRMKSVMPEVEEPLLVSLGLVANDDSKNDRETTPDPLLEMQTSSTQDNEKEPEKEGRRDSTNVSTSKRTLSTSKDPAPAPKTVKKSPATKPPPKKPAEDTFDPNLVIKDEPMSEGEEETIESSFTLKDIPELMQSKSGKRKVIVISTSEENGETSASSSTSHGKAKKTFPNPINQRQVDQLLNPPNGNWMVCIPQAQVVQAQSQSQPPSNRSTPASETQVTPVQMQPNATSTPNSVSILPTTSSNRGEHSRGFNVNPVPPLSYVNVNTNNQRRNSVQVPNHAYVNGSHRRPSVYQQHNLPRLVPRPQGVFTYDGSNFNRDSGPVSRMLSDNAHRVTDFFRNVLVETVTAFAPDVPAAENLMLRSENEKLQREMQTTKSDCQQKMQELRREHQDEIETLKRHYEERIVNLQIQADQDKSKLIKEIRQQCETDKQRAIEMTRKETKKSTWCSNCTKEARFYCCWNTSYCGQQCQKTHWQIHQKYCTNKNSTSENQQHQQQQHQQQQHQVQVMSTNQQVQVMSTNQQVQVNNDSTMSVPVSRLILRSPHLIQQQTVSIQQSQLQPPATMQQQQIIAIPQRTQAMAYPLINVNQMPTNQIYIQQQPVKNNRIQIFPEKIREALPQTSPSSLTVQTIQRNDSPTINVITNQLNTADSMAIRVTQAIAPPISQE